MTALFLSIWLWDTPTCGNPPIAYRAEVQRIHAVATTPGHDDNGTLISEPIYNVWAPTFNSEGPEMSAEDGCEPAAGECCVVIVTGLDEWGMEDAGETCE